MASGNSSEKDTQYVELVDWISLRRNMRITLPFYLGFRFCEDYKHDFVGSGTAATRSPKQAANGSGLEERK